jgi:hypothetical protein
MPIFQDLTEFPKNSALRRGNTGPTSAIQNPPSNLGIKTEISRLEATRQGWSEGKGGGDTFQKFGFVVQWV